MLKYGVDKPDLRNPLVIADVTDEFLRDDVTFNAFKNAIKAGGVVRAVPPRGAASQPRSFFDKLNDWARSEGAPGLGYIVFEEEGGQLTGRGPIAKFIPAEAQAAIAAKAASRPATRCSSPPARGQGGRARRQGPHPRRDELALSDKDQFAFCWITDFPMYEWNEDEKRVDFSHNPFSMPNFDHDAFMALDPEDHATILGIKAFQYDIVCNGIELSSGAIRNHRPR